MADASTDTSIVKTPLQYLDKAMSGLRELGLVKDGAPQDDPITGLLEKISDLEPDKIAVISRTLGQMSTFNEVVREQISEMSIGQRYEGRVPVSHLDLYRLAGDSGLAGEDPALLDDYLTADAIAFVEWPGPAAAVIARPAAKVELVHAGGDERLITIVRHR